jgi:signal transduction histidine kinase
MTSEEVAEKALQPFFTTRTTRKIGLGLPLLKQNAEAWPEEI